MPRATKSGKRPPLISGTGRWVTAMITTGAALAALLVNARNLGIESVVGAMGLGFADRAAHRVTVLPRSDSAFAIGDTLAFAATVTDRRGAVLVGANLRWSSDDSAVAVVDSSGVVVTRGPGTTGVTVRVRELAARATVTVRQVPAGIRVAADTLVPLYEGDTLRLLAFAVDAREQRIRASRPAWHSGDTTVATIDSLGIAHAMAPGRATLAAAVDRHRAEVTVVVALAPGSLELLAGDAQRAPAGQPLPEPITLRVLSRGGTPVPNVAVFVRSASGEGRPAADSLITDRAGRVRVGWTLGPRPGPQRLLARVEALDSVLVAMAEADPARANTRFEIDSTTLQGRVADSLAVVGIRVTDSTGAALADVPVAWAARDGGAADGLVARTDSLGFAYARWTLGPKAGRQRLRVQVGNPRTLPPATLSAVAIAAAPAALAVVSGQGQRAVAGQPLPKAVIVVVRDAFGNPVPDASLTVRPAQGTVTDSALATDSSGRAALRWSLGRTGGVHRLEVRAAGVDSVLVVTARARAGSAANVAFRTPPARATAGTPARIAAAVTDGYGNPVPDVLVVFAAGAGRLSVSRVMTDTSGVAATRWTPGVGGGDQSLTATVRGTAIKATHAVRVTAPTR